MITLRSQPRGQIILMALVFFAIFLSVAGALVTYVVTSSLSQRHTTAAEQALQLAEGGIDLAAYQLNQDSGYVGGTSVLGEGEIVVAITTINTTTKRVTAIAYVPSVANPKATRMVTATLAINSSVVAFRFGVQIGNGGLQMSNNSRITGNVYSNGSIAGASGAVITGDATVAGGNSLSNTTVNGTAWANSLSNCTVGGEAYYMSISSCSVGGTTHPGSANAATTSMPISDEQIDEWEDVATSGGTIEGDYVASGTSVMGPKKINGKLTVSGTLYLTGPVWVRGDIQVNNNASVRTHSSVGSNGVVLIADYPGQESGKGTVQLSNNAVFAGNGNPGSYPMVISTNSSGSAIQLSNNADGVILYASNGTIQVSNNGGANQITAYRLQLSNNATVEYITGLQSASFSNGPGGSWAYVPGTYSITN